ncbi:hypothetical protein [Achromobacter xylosoxidans]|uniref:hypothetical protein n=1 Tax=Alcaligenes xylosoxydans xylosoxydans TaxID=85698 RepID=UPI001F180371|nr:hypothetical protein [Achromobacter xylosoxidans]
MQGLFETKEDGTIIYYGKMGRNAPGYIVDEAAMKAIQRLYAWASVTSLVTIPAMVRAGLWWLSLVVGVILIVVVHLRHKEIVKDLPVSACYFNPGFKKRWVLLSQNASYWMLIPGLLVVFPFFIVAFWRALDDQERSGRGVDVPRCGRRVLDDVRRAFFHQDQAVAR